MEIEHRLQKLICYWVFIHKKLDSVGWMIMAAKIINGTFLILSILQQQICGYLKGTSMQIGMSKFFNIIHGNNIDGEKMEEIGYVAIASFLTFILCVVLYLLLNVNLIEISKNKTVLLYFVYFPIIIILVSEIVYCPISWYYIQYFIDLSQGKDSYGVNLIAFLFFVLMSVYNMKIRLYSVFLFPACLLINFLQARVAIIFFIFLAIMFTYSQKCMVSRLIERSIVLVFCFKVLQSFLPESRVKNLIYLACSLFSLFLITFSKIYHFQSSHSNIQLDQLLVQYVQDLEKAPPSCLQKNRKILMSCVISSLMQKKKDIVGAEMNVSNVMKGINFMTFEELVRIVDIKLMIDSEEEPQNMELKKLILILRIRNQYKVHTTLTKISFLLQSQPTKKFTFKQIYFRKSLQFQIFKEFLSKYGGGSDKIENLIEASQRQQKFIIKSMLLYSNIIMFWKRIKSHILIEVIIEKIIKCILVDFEDLTNLYQSLATLYKPLWESEVMCILTKLIEPNNVSLNIMRTQMTHAKKIKQNSLVFFVLRNKAIVQTSSEFQKAINVSSKQIQNQNISKITPKQVSKSVQQKQELVIKKGFDFSIIPFLSDDSTICVYNVQMKLLPKPNSILEFFYLLNPLQYAENQAFMYISAVSLEVKYVSQEFYDIFQLNKKYSKYKIESEDFYLNDIITNKEPGQIYRELKQKNSIRCDFSLKRLKIRYNKENLIYIYNGNINLIATFGDEILISIVLMDSQDVGDLSRKQSRQRQGTQLNMKNLTVDKRSQMFKMVSFIDQSDHKAVENMSGYFQNRTELKSLNSIHIKKDNTVQQKQEQIFCPIPNRYRQKIQQKQIEITTEGANKVRTYSNCLILLTIIISLFLIVIPIILIGLTKEKTQENKRTFNMLDTSYFSTNFLIYNTYQVYYQYFVSKNKEFFSRFEETFPHNDDAHESDFGEMMQKLYAQVRMFQNVTLKNISKFTDMQKFRQPYKLKFKNFTIDANFGETNYLDYLYNVKLASQKIRYQLDQAEKLNISFIEAQEKQNPLQFLANNYEAIANLQSPFMMLKNLKQSTRQHINKMSIIIAILGFSYFLVFFAIWFVIWKSLDILKDIFSVFAMTSKADVDERFLQLSEISKIYLNEIPKDNFQSLKNAEQYEDPQVTIQENANQKFIQQNLNESMNCFEKNNKKIIINKHKSIKMTALFYIFRLGIATMIYLIIASLLLNLTFYHLKYEELYLEYMDQLKVLKNNQINSSTQMLHFELLRNVYQRDPTTMDVIDEKKSSVDRDIGIGFEESFKYYYSKESQFLRSNLCGNQKGIISMIYTQSLDCKQIGNGILQKGYVQSKQYVDRIKREIKDDLLELLEIPKGQVYPAVMIHMYGKSRVIRQIDNMMDALLVNHTIETDRYTSKLKLLVTLCVLVCLAYLIYLPTKFYPLVFDIKKKSFAYFKMLSHLTFEDIEVSSYIHEKQILKRILSL